jgi:transcriptional regulator with XRE-family HTH domain
MVIPTAALIVTAAMVAREEPSPRVAGPLIVPLISDSTQCLQLQTLGQSSFATRAVANEEALSRRGLREIVIQKYGSLDRFYLETDFSKGHLWQILRGKRSPSLATIVKLAKALDVQVLDFFRPDRKMGSAM